MGKMYVNVVHRADGNLERLEALKYQLSEAHKYDIKATILVSYLAFFQPEVIDYVKEQHEKHGVELGIHFHEINNADFHSRFNTRERQFFLLPFEIQKKAITFLFDKFNELFGFMPSALGSYILDGKTLSFIKQEYPFVKTSIITCFEEGVKVFHSSNNAWFLFNDGGPWSAYYPSNDSHLCPANDKSEAIGILGLPHLNRDMVLSITSRDDLFASHPINVLRAKANVGDKCNYELHFIDQWVKQAEFNGFSYYNLFVSTPWLLASHSSVDKLEDARKIYSESLAYIKHLQDKGKAESQTMSEFADWYSENIGYDKPEVNLWEDILCGSKRQMFWYVDSFMRMAIDLNSGGTVCDLRPLAGRINKDIGPDTDNLWDGNYPYIIATHLRSSSSIECQVSYNGKTAYFSSKRIKGNVSHTKEGKPVLTCEPMVLSIDDLTITVQSVYTFAGNGMMEVERKIIDSSIKDAEVELKEVFTACYGTHEYPESLRGIELVGEDILSNKQSLKFDYLSGKIEVINPSYVMAKMPQVNCDIILKANGEIEKAEAIDGNLSSPYYTLSLQKKVLKGGSLKSCLIIKKK